MGGRTTRRIGAGVIVAAASVLLGGCSLLHGNYGPVPTPSASKHVTAAVPTPTGTPPVPLPAPTLTPLAPGTVVASGSVVSPKGSVRYAYRIVANGSDDFQIVCTDISSTLPVPVSVALAPAQPSIAVGDGLGTNRGASGVLSAPTTTVTIGAGHDPSPFTQLVTFSSVAPSQAASVPVELGPDKVLAVSPVAWHIPIRTSNVHPVDGGARVYAYGVITSTRADGQPSVYLVAHGDRASVVAQRFGISVKDLEWLNPSMNGKPRLYEGTDLNLDPDAL